MDTIKNIEESLPPSGSEVTSLVILLHGLGANGADLISLADEWRSVLPNTAFVSPNAPFPCDMAPMGFQWFSLQSRDPKDILAGVEHAAPIVDEFIQAQKARFGLSANKIAVVGFSQGTMLGLYTVLRQKEDLAAFLGYSGAMIGAVDKLVSDTPICLFHGDLDDVVPDVAFDAAMGALKAANFDVQGQKIAGLGHGIDYSGLSAGGAFLVEKLAAMQ